MRIDGRLPNELRKTEIITDFTKYAEGSVLIKCGGTWVLCNATVAEKVPAHQKGSGEGWVTAEYAMLPRATKFRNSRDVTKLKLSGRSAEIQRLIGRALRAAVDLKKLGERTIIIDCDVLQADGGTRTASINGGYIALSLAVRKLLREGLIEENPIVGQIASISAGVKDGEVLLDLCYEEDSDTDVDMNVVMDDNFRMIELQGTGEQAPFSKEELEGILAITKEGISEIFRMQKEALLEETK